MEQLKVICPCCGKPLTPADVNTKCEGSLRADGLHPVVVMEEFKEPWNNHDDVQRAAVEE